jgi:hypothetical protein
MSPAQEFGYACRLAREHGMFVVDKPAGDGTEHILYRKTPTRPVRLGRRRDIGEFRRFVEACAGIKK